MSWSFQISGGDLNPVSNASGMGIVTGRDKTFQDLKLWMLESMGTDPMHPEHGSLLDGGRLPNGTVVESFIGSETLSAFRVEEEVSRILKSFSQSQKNRINSDIANLGKTTVSDSEIIDKITSIQSTLFGTKLIVRVSIQTRGGNTITLTQPVG